MGRFTKELMQDELRTIFLYEADHILMGCGEEMAKRFIGFSPGASREYLGESPARVDLRRFAISDLFDLGYDFAFHPSLLHTLDGAQVQDLVVFMLGTPRAGGTVSGGTTHRFMTPDGYCQTVADTALARWKLDAEQDDSFTVRELALLAGMSEGAVRNAIADKTGNGLKAIKGSKPVQVGYDEAKRWLLSRRSFIPSPRRANEDPVLLDRLRGLQTAESLGQLVSFQLWSVCGSPDNASAALGLSAEEIEGWRSGAFRFDLDQAQQLARSLEFDVPLFVGKALELSLRRDSLRADGGQA